MRTFTFLLCLCFFGTLASYGQPNGSDPAVTAARLAPTPLAGIGSPFSITFTIGNNGVTDISGRRVLDYMQFGTSLGYCAAPLELGSVSGDILSVVYQR